MSVMAMAVDREEEGDTEDLRALLTSLSRTPDFSASRANARLELHEAICAERYNSILGALERGGIQAAALHARLDKVSGRMWAAAATGLGMGLVAVATLLVLILTRGLK
jgi:DNA-binding FadR family transcriptional regulator